MESFVLIFFFLIHSRNFLTIIQLNPDISFLENVAEPDQMASGEAI